MGKRIISQARGKGSFSYRVKRKAFVYRLQYPRELKGQGTVLNLINSPAHSAPIARIKYDKGIFYIPAFKGMIEGQKIMFEGNEISGGNILKLRDIPVKTNVYNIESKPGDGGIFIKTAGSSATVSRVGEKEILIFLPSKKERGFHPDCRAIVGVVAGAGRLDKPILKAGKKHHMTKARGKLWPRTSAVKMNVIDHPFGSGRGKRIKSKIAKRNAPPGRRVGHLRPKRTGKR
ncbi:MAG: 50S ribosomal protein L2 [Candidatus Pacearchaeota archaeon]